MYTHQIGIFFSLFAFYCILKVEYGKKVDTKYIFISGLFAGFSLISDFPMLLIVFPFTISTDFDERKTYKIHVPFLYFGRICGVSSILDL